MTRGSDKNFRRYLRIADAVGTEGVPKLISRTADRETLPCW